MLLCELVFNMYLKYYIQNKKTKKKNEQYTDTFIISFSLTFIKYYTFFLHLIGNVLFNYLKHDWFILILFFFRHFFTEKQSKTNNS